MRIIALFGTATAMIGFVAGFWLASRPFPFWVSLAAGFATSVIIGKLATLYVKLLNHNP